MKLPGYYSSGEFAKMAGVSLRTIRFYDKQDILKPSYINPSGARFYTGEDFVKLQQILLLKYLGFSLEDIKELSIDTTDCGLMLKALEMQKKLVQDRIEQMQLVEKAISDTVSAIETEKRIDWSSMLELIRLTGTEKSPKTQYINSSNMSARIRLHRDYSVNRQGWFSWIVEQCRLKAGMKVLELGCGNGAMWVENMTHIPEDISVVLTDISDGMLKDAKRSLEAVEKQFEFERADCHELPFEAESFDLVIANHVLFHCEDIQKVCNEVRRVLKTGGRFICGTYGRHHMSEVRVLVREFDRRIELVKEELYERFGIENGKEILEDFFTNIYFEKYEDELLVTEAEPLLEYIYSCHGNQNKILLDRYPEFRSFVEYKVKSGFRISKEAGIFISEK